MKANKRLPNFPKLITEDSFRKWLKKMDEKELSFHLDDDASDVVYVRTGESVFTDAQAYSLNLFLERAFGQLGAETIWDIAGDVLDIGVVEDEKRSLGCGVCQLSLDKCRCGR